MLRGREYSLCKCVRIFYGMVSSPVCGLTKDLLSHSSALCPLDLLYFWHIPPQLCLKFSHWSSTEAVLKIFDHLATLLWTFFTSVVFFKIFRLYSGQETIVSTMPLPKCPFTRWKWVFVYTRLYMCML